MTPVYVLSIYADRGMSFMSSSKDKWIDIHSGSPAYLLECFLPIIYTVSGMCYSTKVKFMSTLSGQELTLHVGPIYLFRVALALIMLCKRPIMTINLAQAGRGAIIELLGRPPMSVIPQDPEAFIAHTFTVKVRDEDIRKQRSKREAQWKKDRLAQRGS